LRLESETGAAAGELVITGTGAAAPGALPAGGFRAITYRLDIPDTLAGPTTLRLLDVEANAPMLRITAAKTSPTGISHDRAAGSANESGAITAVPQPDGTPGVNPGEDVEAQSNPGFLANLSGYDPMYFDYSPVEGDAKFQLSFKYAFVYPDGAFARAHPWLRGFHFAYTQTAFWDLAKDSAPFRDINFKPELFYRASLTEYEILPGASSFGVQVGVQHESNGRGGSASRSLNIVYVEPAAVWPLSDDLELSMKLRAWSYFGDLDGNHDIADYRGHASLALGLGDPDGFMANAWLRGNPGTGNGALQLDATYPLNRIFDDGLDLYLHGQLFTGYGENLLEYDDEDTRFRLGISIYR
jgi:outer membrane phospholipase A